MLDNYDEQKEIHNSILEKIDLKYGTNFASKDEFFPFANSNFIVYHKLSTITKRKDLDKPTLKGNYFFIHNEFQENPYQVKLSSPSIVDIYYHLHLGIKHTEDYDHNFLEALRIEDKNEVSYIYTECGS